MIVEHSFVTTKPPVDLLNDAQSVLIRLGFMPEPANKPGEVNARRGCTKPARAADVTRLPQKARILYDRGLVMIAASLEHAGRELPKHKELLLALALAIEEQLAGGTVRKASEAWHAFNAAIQRRTRIRRWCIAGAFALAVLAVVATIIVVRTR